jgi:hypothetical protein
MNEHVIITITPTLDTGQQAAISIREIVQGDKGEKGEKGDTVVLDDLTARFDKGHYPIYYMGEAQANTPESSPLWRIKRVDMSGETIVILFADGNDDFDNIWSDHLTLTYS